MWRVASITSMTACRGADPEKRFVLDDLFGLAGGSGLEMPRARAATAVDEGVAPSDCRGPDVAASV